MKILTYLHQLCYRVFSIADVLLKLGGDQSRRFGLVEFLTSSESFLSEESDL